MAFIQPSEASQANSQQLSLAENALDVLVALLKRLTPNPEEEVPAPEPMQATLELPQVTSLTVVNQWDQGTVDKFWRQYISDSSSSFIDVDYEYLQDKSLTTDTGLKPDLEGVSNSLLPPAFDSPKSGNELNQSIVATTAVVLVAKLGVDGKYQSEAYTITSDDSIYTVSDADGLEIAQFDYQNNLADFTFDLTTAEQKNVFINAADQSKNLTEHQDYAAAIAKLGDLAPAGSRAVVVANNILTSSGQNSFTGAQYTFKRSPSGDISIASNKTKKQILCTDKGQISSQSMTPTDLANFRQAFQKMSQSDLTKSSRSKPPDLER